MVFALSFIRLVFCRWLKSYSYASVENAFAAEADAIAHAIQEHSMQSCRLKSPRPLVMNSLRYHRNVVISKSIKSNATIAIAAMIGKIQIHQGTFAVAEEISLRISSACPGS